MKTVERDALDRSPGGSLDLLFRLILICSAVALMITSQLQAQVPTHINKVIRLSGCPIDGHHARKRARQQEIYRCFLLIKGTLPWYHSVREEGGTSQMHAWLKQGRSHDAQSPCTTEQGERKFPKASFTSEAARIDRKAFGGACSFGTASEDDGLALSNADWRPRRFASTRPRE